MILYDVATTQIDTESFPQHIIADLNSGFTFIVLFSQKKPLRWKEINTQATHTHKKRDTCQYNVPLAIIRAIRGFLKERLYQELGFQYLNSQRRIKIIGTFYKIANPFFPIPLRSGISSVWTYVTLSHKKIFKKIFTQTYKKRF